ncbi:MAG: carbohydrate ABC transporter permease [Elusimicrobiota bacterium]
MKRKPFEPLIYLSPGMFFLAIFILLPIFFLLVLSFFDWNMFTGEYSFIGIKNYADMITNSEFYNACINTAIYVLGTVPAGMAAALFIAVLINRKIRWFAIYRTSIFLPVIVSLAASGIIWLWIYNYRSGILNHLLLKIGLSKVDWLGDPGMALFSVILVTLWKRIGYNMVIFFAGLQVIPTQLYEAAKIDGAKAVNQFRYVTWPNLLPTTSFVLVINVFFAFRDFSQIYVMTRGGPMGRTTTLVYYMYELAFKEFSIGRAASVAMILFAVVMLVTYLKIKYIDEKIEA